MNGCTAARHGNRSAYAAGCRCPEAREANRRYAAARARRNLQAQYGATNPLTVTVDKARIELDRLEAGGWGRRRLADELSIGRDHLSRLAGRTCRPLARVRWATYARLCALPDSPPTRRGGELVDATGTWRRLEGLIALGWPKAELARKLGIGRALQLHRDLVTVRNAGKVAALFDELSGTPGPSRQARQYAQRHGYVPPLAWDDDTIDDPAARPWSWDTTSSPSVDEVAVQRALAGEHVSLPRDERGEALVRLIAAGLTPSEAGRRLRLSGASTRALLDEAS